MISENVNSILRAIVSNLQTPVVIVLLAMIVATIFVAGTFVFEFLVEHRKMKADIPKLLEIMNETRSDDLKKLIDEKQLLPRQKAALSKLLDAKNMDSKNR